MTDIVWNLWQILYDKTHSGIWVINIKKRYENKVYLRGLILKIRHIFWENRIKKVAVKKWDIGNGTQESRKETSKVAIRQYTLINKP